MIRGFSIFKKILMNVTESEFENMMNFLFALRDDVQSFCCEDGAFHWKSFLDNCFI